MASENEAGTIGFVVALIAVFFVGVTISISRCSMVDDIADDCDDYGKFESNDLTDKWYECKKIGETK